MALGHRAAETEEPSYPVWFPSGSQLGDQICCTKLCRPSLSPSSGCSGGPEEDRHFLGAWPTYYFTPWACCDVILYRKTLQRGEATPESLESRGDMDNSRSFWDRGQAWRQGLCFWPLMEKDPAPSLTCCWRLGKMDGSTLAHICGCGENSSTIQWNPRSVVLAARSGSTNCEEGRVGAATLPAEWGWTCSWACAWMWFACLSTRPRAACELTENKTFSARSFLSGAFPDIVLVSPVGLWHPAVVWIKRKVRVHPALFQKEFKAIWKITHGPTRWHVTHHYYLVKVISGRNKRERVLMGVRKEGVMTSLASLLGAIKMGVIIAPASKGCFKEEVCLGERWLTCTATCKDSISVNYYCYGSEDYSHWEALLGGSLAYWLGTSAFRSIEYRLESD